MALALLMASSVALALTKIQCAPYDTGGGCYGDTNPSDLNDVMSGTEYSEYMYGGEGNDRLYGYGGPDYLLGEAGNDALNGGDGDDLLNGREGDDTLNGGDGGDTLHGFFGINTLSGGPGADTLYTDYGDNAKVSAGSGNDVVYAADQASHVEARAWPLVSTRSRSFFPSVTTPLYGTTVAHALRQTLRNGVMLELPRTSYRRTSENTPSPKMGE